MYQLMPIAPIEGRMVLNWSELGWGMVFLPALAFYPGVVFFLL